MAKELNTEAVNYKNDTKADAVALFQAMADNAPVLISIYGPDQNCSFVNQRWLNFTGRPLEKEVRLGWAQTIHASDKSDVLENFIQNFIEKKEFQVKYRMLRADGEYRWVLYNAAPFYINPSEFAGFIATCIDITETQKIRSDDAVKKNEERFRALIEKSSDVISLINADGQAFYTSPSIKRVLGHEPIDSAKSNIFEYIHPADIAYVQKELENLVLKPNGTVIAEMRVKHDNGTWRWIETVNTNLLHVPDISAIVVNLRDITEKKIAEEKSEYQNYHDSLTSLPNRNFFTEQLGEMTAHVDKKKFGMMIIDLDRFKIINESLGHAVGDKLIKEVSLRFAGSLDSTNILARLGGDEYGIILENIIREEEVGQLCSQILEGLKTPFVVDGHELYITPSIGITVFPHDGIDVSTLLKNADSALYRAKEMGRNNFQYYNPSMNATTFQQLAMENTLRKALENNEFLVYYIPQIDVKTGKIIQVEALIRWMHPELGLTFPDEFIPIAETTGLIQPIGEWVLKTACEQIKKIQNAGHDIGLSVNLSAKQFRQKHIIRSIRSIMLETGFDPNKMEFELTESAIVDNSHDLYNAMIQLEKDGVKFAIDDFTTGHSSLYYVKKFPVHSLKVSYDFMKGVPMKEKDTAIANAIINLSKSLNLSVTAEGVERLDQLKFLQDQECNKAQGYLFSPPIPVDQLLQLLDKNPSWV